MSANKVGLFVVLFVLLTGAAIGAISSADAGANDTVSSAKINSLLELQAGIFDSNQNSQSKSSPPFTPAPLPGTGDDKIIEITSALPLLNISQTKKSNKFELIGPINMRKIIPIVLESSIDSKIVKIGDPVRARLKENLYYGNRLLARANSTLNGHVTSYRSSRTFSSSLLQPEDRWKSNAALEIQFDNLLTDNNATLPLSGRPVHQESVRLGADGLLYGITVDSQGKIVQGGRTLSNNKKNTANTLRVATMAPIPTGLLLNIIGAPILMGTIGAISPEIAFNRPLNSSMSHKRLKGAAYGFITNLPGAFFVQATVEKGNEIVLNNGDEMMIDMAMNNLNCSQLAHKETVNFPEKLSVEGKLLKETPASTAHCLSLPLKSFINPSENVENTSTPSVQEIQTTEAPIPGTQFSSCTTQALDSNDRTEKTLE